MSENITIPVDHVCIPLEVYDDLMMDSNRYYDLREMIFRNTNLSYMDGKISIPDEKLEIVLRTFDSPRYDKRVRHLAGKENDNERTD